VNAEQKKRRSDAVLRIRRETRERRERLATDFRARLIVELGDARLSASRDALVEAATSAYVQTVELSARFNHAVANPRSVQALSLARGQLQRALLLLGLATYDATETTTTPSTASARDWLAAQDGVA